MFECSELRTCSEVVQEYAMCVFIANRQIRAIRRECKPAACIKGAYGGAGQGVPEGSLLLNATVARAI